LAGGPAERFSWLSIGWLLILTDFSFLFMHTYWETLQESTSNWSPFHFSIFPKFLHYSVSNANKVSKKKLCWLFSKTRQYHPLVVLKWSPKAAFLANIRSFTVRFLQITGSQCLI
jgi:hypothetical protein